MKSGDIVLIPLPQSDGAIKRRPALLIKQMPPFNDWLLYGISTQLQQKVVKYLNAMTIISHKQWLVMNNFNSIF